MSLGKISFNISSTGPCLCVKVTFDGQEIIRIDNLEDSPREISHEFDDSEDKDHLLEIEMYGKTHEHTIIDDQGNILQDRVIKITDMALDNLLLGPLFPQFAEYHHDGNGSRPATVEKFYDTMGCNGTVRFRFSSPFYLWMLENL